MSAEPEETSDWQGLVCPYCEYLDRDAFELARDGSSGETECKQCDRKFEWSIETYTTYCGKPIAKEGE